MVIGIVGSGKMGQDILKYLLDYEMGIVVVCRAEEKRKRLNESIGKQLRRKRKRGLITEEQYEARMQGIVITDDFNKLSPCDLVIETVIEDLIVKKEVMKKIEDSVSEECMIATNTSSFEISSIFCECKKRERCFGLHFFYPVKITSYVEINCTEAVLIDVVERIKEMLDGLQIRYITLNKDGNLIINKLISTIVSFACEIYREGKLGYSEIDEIIKRDIMMFGAFELVDSTGFYIILQSVYNFMHNFDERYYELYQGVEEQIQNMRRNGFLGDAQTGGFLKSEQENQVVNAQATKEYEDKVADRLKAVILNDLAFYCNQGVALPEELFDAVYTILGFDKQPKDMFIEMGKEKVTQILDQEYARSSKLVYMVQNFNCYE